MAAWELLQPLTPQQRDVLFAYQIPLANDPCGRTALSAAVMLAWEGMVAVLLELGCPVTVRDGTGNLPLHGAATEAATRSPGQLQAVMRRLLHAGACISCRAPDQKQPLHFAAEWAEGRTHVIEFLVAQGADVGALDAEGCSPLIIATYRGDTEAMDALLRHGARVDVADNDGETALHYALLWTGDEGMRHAEREAHRHAMAQRLLQAAPDAARAAQLANLQNMKEGVAALHLAALHCMPSVVRLLLQHGADPNLQAKDGTTALHNAADQAEGHDDAADQLELRLQAAKLLLEAGAEPKRRDKQARTPLSLACSNGFRQLGQLLSSARPATQPRARPVPGAAGPAAKRRRGSCDAGRNVHTQVGQREQQRQQQVVQAGQQQEAQAEEPQHEMQRAQQQQQQQQQQPLPASPPQQQAAPPPPPPQSAPVKAEQAQAQQLQQGEQFQAQQLQRQPHQLPLPLPQQPARQPAHQASPGTPREGEALPNAVQAAAQLPAAAAGRPTVLVSRGADGVYSVVAVGGPAEAALDLLYPCMDPLAQAGWAPQLTLSAQGDAAELTAVPAPAAAAAGSAEALLLALRQPLESALAAGDGLPEAGGAPAAQNAAIASVGGRLSVVVPAARLLAPDSGNARYSTLAATLGQRLGAAHGWELAAVGGSGRLVLWPGQHPGPQLSCPKLLSVAFAALQ